MSGGIFCFEISPYTHYCHNLFLTLVSSCGGIAKTCPRQNVKTITHLIWIMFSPLKRISVLYSMINLDTILKDCSLHLHTFRQSESLMYCHMEWHHQKDHHLSSHDIELCHSISLAVMRDEMGGEEMRHSSIVMKSSLSDGT